MAWNKKNYYYQNQIKVLSGTDAEPGYKENDEDNLSEAELKNRVDGVNGDDTKPGNGLYKLVSLIKTKFRQLRDSNWSLIDLNIKSYPDGSKLSDTDNLNSLNGENTFNKHDGSADTIGNFYHASTGRSSDFNKEDLSLNDNEILDEDLIKYKVITKDGKYGTIKEIFMASPENKILRLELDKEVLVPFNSPMIINIDKEKEEITIDIIDGMQVVV